MQKMRRTFVASSTLKPMAKQLLDFRTPAAYAGVEAFAHKHAGTDEGAMANLVLGSVVTKVLAKCSTPVLLIR